MSDTQKIFYENLFRDQDGSTHDDDDDDDGKFEDEVDNYTLDFHRE